MNLYLASVDQRPWIPEIIYSNSYENDIYYPLHLIKKNNNLTMCIFQLQTHKYIWKPDMKGV